MEIARDIKEFLMTRRAKITPDQVGLPVGMRRRVTGLRREEVAQLAGVSAEYYIQIERGQVGGVSDEVLHAIAAALQLDEAETDHLFDLARAATTRTRRRRAPANGRAQVPQAVCALIDAMVGAPALVQNAHLDVVAANELGRALYADVFDRASGRPNLARFLFLDGRADEVFPDWDKAADHAVALLRAEAARSPYSAAITGLVGELATRSEAFRTRWAAHNVQVHRRGTKRFHHPAVGEMTLQFEALAIAGDAGLTLVGYTAEPGSASDQALRLLSSWIATERHSATPPPAQDPAAHKEVGS